MQALVILADGSEEIEAVTVIDILRRGGINTISASLFSGPVRASRGVVLLADALLDEAMKTSCDLLVLPGGAEGTEAMSKDERVLAKVREQNAQRKWLAAICAAPKVLAKAGVLAGKHVTSYPGALEGARNNLYEESPVVVDGHIVTSRGPGTAMDFALTLVELLAGRSCREEVETRLMRP